MLASMVFGAMTRGRRVRARRGPARATRFPRAPSRQKRNECPACACTASATFSSAVKCGNSDVIWNERASPSRLRPCTGSAVMSWPSKWMRPASGTISPASWPISVVLPAPFGPMMACSSPLRHVEPDVVGGDHAAEALGQAFDLEQRVSHGVARPRQQAVDAAAREQHDQQQHRAEDELPVFARALDLVAGQELARPADQDRQRLLQHQQRDRADHRAEHRAHAAQHRHDDEIAGARPEHDRRVDEIGVVGEQRAGEAAHHAGDDEAGELVAEGRKADGAHAPLVGARALDHHAEARMHQPPDEIDASPAAARSTGSRRTSCSTD